MEDCSGRYDPYHLQAFIDSQGTTLNADVAAAFPSHSFGSQSMYHNFPPYEHNAMAQQNLHQSMGYVSSTRSSASSNLRLSNNSGFSQHHYRGSVASTNTTWSTNSRSSKEYHLSQTQQILNANSTTSAYRNPPQVQVAKPSRSLSQSSKQLAYQNPPQVQVAKPSRSLSQNFKQSACATQEPFSTCISRKKRARRSLKEPRYWCTSCQEGFGEKYDWKRHEETYQERSETYQCELCNKTYFLDKDFIHHHRESHRCKTCVDKKHVDIARRERQTRTGWGCGFCLRYDSDWTERCNHIAWHFEKNGDTIAGWKQSQVIYSLLQQPLLRREWLRLLESKQELDPSFRWSHRLTGRAEGYPESEKPGQLQDLLEYFTPDQNASVLVALAYEMGHQPKRDAPQACRQKSPPVPDKELPAPPPPVPPKDIHHFGAVRPTAARSASQPASEDFIPWDKLISTIPEDELLPAHDPMCFMEPYVDWDMGGEGNLHEFYNV